ncbi:MAG: chemotaxis protein CheW [Myxococcales bacterium]|nr:chemotaxis protein CheW [Myxococcales bacterium]
MKPRLLASDLRDAFDGSFAVARDPAEELEDVLAIRVGDSPHAIRMGEIASLFADRAVTSLPSRRPDLIGLVGFRGAFVPVFDLARLLGHAPSGAALRWMVVVAGGAFALAFEGFEQHLRVSRAAIVPYAGAGATPSHVREVVHTGGQLRPLIDITSLIETITRPLGET